MRNVRLWIALFAMLVTASVASAQTSSLRGRVADLQGGVVADAEVSLRDLPTAPSMPGMPGMRMPSTAPRTTRSARDGTFVFDQVAAGRYVLQADAPGFQRSSQEIAVPTTEPIGITLEALLIVGAAEAAALPAAQVGGNTQALLDRIRTLEDRLSQLESSTVLSEPETRVKRVEVWVDRNGVEYDRPVEGARRTVTYQRERVYRRQTINEKIEEALAAADERSVALGIDAATATQVSTRTRGGNAAPASGNAYALASADLFFTARLAQYTIFFADVVALSGSPPDREIPGLTLLNGYTARLVNQNELNLREAWLRTELFGQRLALTAGRLDLTNYFDHNAAANDETTQFLGDGLVNNPALGLATNGTGLAALFDPKIGLTFGIGVQQSNPDATNLSDSIYSLAEIGYLATPLGLPEGHYRVWYRATNTGNDTTTAFGVSLDQKITPIITLFGRYGDGRIPAGGGGQTSFSLGHHFYSGGVQFQNGWVFYPRDSWGIGYARTSAADESREHLTEGYYNFQLTERLRLSFHVQHIFESRPDTPSFGYLVPGVRLQATF